jgi:predicted ATP-dependent endonuclease of OLD family
MKQLLLKEILLLSQKEKSALSLKFDPKRTVIVGLNSTGKSCLMKSIYYTFGAQPHQMHSSWIDAQVSSLVRFTVDRLPYSILRQGKFYTLFDLHDEIVAQTTKASEIGVVLAKLCDFKIRLIDKTGEMVTPPPAYLFLPFYVDQDQGWSKTWASFDRLYLPNARRDIASYHTGLRPNEYYEAKGEIKLYEEKIKSLDNEEKLVRNLLGNLKEKLTDNDFNVSIEDFKKEITELLVNCEELNAVQNKLKHNLAHLYNSKINIEAQQKITKRALEESHSDYVYAVDTLGDTVQCPSCGAQYENDFASRFGMAQDEQRCLELLAELKEEWVETDKAIEKVKQDFSGNNTMIVEIEKKLEAKKEEV